VHKTSNNTDSSISTGADAASGSNGSALHRTARQISKRTTDLIAIAIVTIGVLTVSGRLSEWWQTEPTSITSPSASAALSAGSPVQWGIGESAVSVLAGEHAVQMERRVIFGDQDRVDGILRSRLVEIAESQPSRIDPTLRSENAKQATVDAKFARQEERLLKLLKNVDPIESQDGQWNLYRLDQTDNPLPGSFLIATRIAKGQEKLESLAAWAIATPSSPTQWTSFVLTPTAARQADTRNLTPVPADGRLLISLRTNSQDELTVFQKVDARQSDINRWVHDVSNQLTATGWHEARSWQQSDSSAAARFERSATAQHRSHLAIELTISLSAAGKLTGTSNVFAVPALELVPFDTTQPHAPLDKRQ
jgi:hypothetical protein